MACKVIIKCIPSRMPEKESNKSTRMFSGRRNAIFERALTIHALLCRGKTDFRQINTKTIRNKFEKSKLELLNATKPPSFALSCKVLLQLWNPNATNQPPGDSNKRSYLTSVLRLSLNHLNWVFSVPYLKNGTQWKWCVQQREYQLSNMDSRYVMARSPLLCTRVVVVHEIWIPVVW